MRSLETVHPKQKGIGLQLGSPPLLLPLLLESLLAAALEITVREGLGQILFVAIMSLPISCPQPALWGCAIKAPT